MKNFFYSFVLISAFFLVGCGESIIAEAGEDQTVSFDQKVILESKSIDTTVLYQWEQRSGQSVELENSNSARASFIAPDSEGVLIFRLTVTEKKTKISDFDEVRIIVSQEDQAKPSIELNGAKKIILVVGDTYIEEGAIAKDAKGKELSVSIDDTSVNTSKVGKYTVIYTAEDNVGHQVSVERKVWVVESDNLVKKYPLTPANCKGYIEKSGKDVNANGELEEEEVESVIEFYEEGAPISKADLRMMIRKGEDVTGVNTCKITDMSYLISIAVPDYDTDSGLPEDEKENILKFNQDISGWNTGSVENMMYMFYHSEAFNQSIGKWNTSNVVNMSRTFLDAEAFNQPLDAWDTSKVTDMEAMFARTKKFNQNLREWDVSSVVNYKYFSEESSLWNRYRPRFK